MPRRRACLIIFPVKIAQGICRQAIAIARDFSPMEAAIGPDFAIFPVIFPVSRESDAETGSLETVPSAIFLICFFESSGPAHAGRDMAVGDREQLTVVPIAPPEN